MISCQICLRKHVGSLKLFLFQKQVVLCSLGHLLTVLCSVATVRDKINLEVLAVSMGLVPQISLLAYVRERSELRIGKCLI